MLTPIYVAAIFSHKSYGINIDYLGLWTVFWIGFPFISSHSFIGSSAFFAAINHQIFKAGRCFEKTKTEMKATSLVHFKPAM